MKTLIVTVLFFVRVIVSIAQSNVVVFSEQGEPFLLIVNGVQQNPTPETNVRLTGLQNGAYKLKVLFKDASILPLDKSMYIDSQNETTIAIKQNKNHEYVMRLMSQVPIYQTRPAQPMQKVMVYNTVPIAPTQIITETNTTTHEGRTNHHHCDGDNVNVGLNMGPVSINMDINGYDNHHRGNTNSTTTTTSTTVVGGGYVNTQPVQQVYVLPGYNGAVGCNWPMDNQEFNSAINSIKNQTFDDAKMTVAKQITTSKCLLTDQVVGILALFTFENDKLDFAKFAYSYTFDIDNYFKVNNAFTYSSSITDLDQYIRSGR